MAVYIKKFDLHADYADYITSPERVLPNVSHCVDMDDVHYNPRSAANEYLTIEALESGDFSFYYDSMPYERYSSGNVPSGACRYMEYSIDNGETWTKTMNDGTQLTITVPVNAGDIILWRGDNDGLGTAEYSYSRRSKFITGIRYNVRGNVMSLLYPEDFQTNTELPYTRLHVETESPPEEYYNVAFRELFADTPVVSADKLVLPSTVLAPNCYESMFYDCTSLVKAPELPATELNFCCYEGMFHGCTSLTTAPELPATALSYTYPIYETNEIVGTGFSDSHSCYAGMFFGCTSLVKAPELPATLLSTRCYSAMFSGCTSMTNVPRSLNGAMTYEDTINDYTYEFGNCYSEMFAGCSSLVNAPDLPATTLANSCYSFMFYACTSLVKAPVLPATTLANSCYSEMFDGCSSLNYIKAMFTTTPGTSYTYDWVNGISSTGTFVKNSAATWTTTGVHGIPTGWTVETASN